VYREEFFPEKKTQARGKKKKRGREGNKILGREKHLTGEDGA